MFFKRRGQDEKNTARSSQTDHRNFYDLYIFHRLYRVRRYGYIDFHFKGSLCSDFVYRPIGNGICGKRLSDGADRHHIFGKNAAQTGIDRLDECVCTVECAQFPGAELHRFVGLKNPIRIHSWCIFCNDNGVRQRNGTARKTVAVAASMNGGFTIALMLGVPFGSYLGDLFNWRIVFLMIACLGLIGLAGIWLTVPHRKPKVVPKLIHEWDVFKNKQVLFSFAITIFGYSGVFIAYTFIEPMLRHSAGFDSLGITAALFAYGFGGVVGIFYAGKVPFHLLTRSMIGVMIALMAILAAFPFVSGHPAGAIIVTFLFGAGAFAFGTVPLLQTKVVAASEHGTTIATSVSIAAFNLANALGAWIGGLILNASESTHTLPQAVRL